jgi:hypothetical protein
VIAADGDRAYFRDAIEKWAERDRDVTLRSVKGAHIGEGEPAVHRRNARDAMRWLMRGAKPYYTS